MLHVQYNSLITLPATVVALPRSCDINVTGNPVESNVRDQLQMRCPGRLQVATTGRPPASPGQVVSSSERVDELIDVTHASAWRDLMAEQEEVVAATRSLSREIESVLAEVESEPPDWIGAAEEILSRERKPPPEMALTEAPGSGVYPVTRVAFQASSFNVASSVAQEESSIQEPEALGSLEDPDYSPDWGLYSFEDDEGEEQEVGPPEGEEGDPEASIQTEGSSRDDIERVRALLRPDVVNLFDQSFRDEVIIETRQNRPQFHLPGAVLRNPVSRPGFARAVEPDLEVLQAAAPKEAPILPELASDAEVPSHFVCPITHEAMREPVVAPDGFTYERTAIEKWLCTSQLKSVKSPMTGETMESNRLTPNHVLRSMIADFYDKHKKKRASP